MGKGIARAVRIVVAILLAIVLLLAAALYVSPWPSVLAIRTVFDHGAEQAADALAPKVPPGLSVRTGLSYDAANPDARLDIYRPLGAAPSGPTVVWFHGGGFVSGRRADIANYLKILAGKGFTVVNVDYTIAPEATYPTPTRQANAALRFLSARSAELGIDAQHLVLAGDSAGSQIAAQTAAVVTDPAYARLVGVAPGVRADQLAGALLYCGMYDLAHIGQGGGLVGWFVGSAAWAYSGERDWRHSSQFATLSVVPHVTAAFPPAFIAAGNADPLGPQSVVLAQALKAKGVKVTEQFYPAGYRPRLSHEYQFDLDTAAGRETLDRSAAWLRGLTALAPR